MSFKKLNTKIYEKAALTPDNIYWKQLGAPVLVKEFGLIDHIDFSPIEPHYFAVTCSVRVQVYNPITKLVVKNLSRFRENAYGAVFRKDGQLLCAGSEEKTIKLFDVSTKRLLRLFKGHEAPVHRTHFVNDTHIASFSDDKTVRIWNIPTEETIMSYTEHSDYIRAGAVSPVAPDIVLSGGYDNIVKMYDTRMKNVVLTVNHGSPVESLLFLPFGGIFLSAGGTDIKVWDTFAGGKLLGSISQHHKTVTCLQMASDNKRILSGSLDKHVKVYDVGTFQVVHTLDYPGAVLSLGVSKNDDTLVAGLSDGLLVINRREEKTKPTEKKKASFQYKANTHHPSVDLVVPETKNEKETKYNYCLRKFEYSKALDCVLLSYVSTKTPQVTVSVMRELIRRRGLHKAFQGRETKSLLQILRFFIRNIAVSRFQQVLMDAANIFIDVYEDQIHTLSSEVKNEFVQLTAILTEDSELVVEYPSLQGAIYMLMSAASVNEQVTQENNVNHNLVASADAQKNLVINLG